MIIKLNKMHSWPILTILLITVPLTVVLAQTTNSPFNRDTITIASEPDYSPFCFVDKEGRADGFSVELFKAAAKAVGLETVIHIGVWNQIKEDLANGKIDALPLVGRTPEREPLYDFTMSYLSLRGAVFVKKSTTDIQSLADLQNKEVLVMKGDNAEEFVLRENITSRLSTTHTFEEAFHRLARGEGDAVITQRIVGLQLLEELNIKSIKPLELQLPEFTQDFCFAVKKGDEALLAKLNEGLSIIIANNTYNEIHAKWFGPKLKERLAAIDIVKIVAIVLLPFVIIFLISVIMFRRSVMKRETERMNREIEDHKMMLENQQKLLRANEEHIGLLLDSTAEGIFGINNYGDCTFINSSALELLGYTGKKEVLGKNMHYLVHHTHLEGIECSFEDCKIYRSIVVGNRIHSEDEVLWRKDGSSFPAEYFSHPIRTDEKIVGAVVTFWDITDRKLNEEQLKKSMDEQDRLVKERTKELNEKVQKLDRSQQAMLYMVEDLNKITAELKEERRKLKTSNRELEAFTYSVSHDLRAPLRAINGFSKFLVEDYTDMLDKEGKRYLNTICQNADRMDQLISDLLNLSRVSRVSLAPTKVKMEDIVTSMYYEMANQNEQKEFNIIIKKMPTAKCDSTLIKQVWQNLISNALKYSSKAKTKKIEVGGQEKEGKNIYYIRDWGAGYDPKYARKLFGIFQRLHTSDEFEGTGVGLAIVQRIIHRHGGEVWADGNLDKGATFYFSLPKI